MMMAAAVTAPALRHSHRQPKSRQATLPLQGSERRTTTSPPSRSAAARAARRSGAGGLAVAVWLLGSHRAGLRRRRVSRCVRFAIDPNMPVLDLPALSPQRAQRLQELLAAFPAAYGEFVESSETRKEEYETLFYPRFSSPYYGELDQESIARLLELGGISEQDTIVDVGSGLGKLVVVAAALTSARLVVGVELSPSRHQQGLRGLEKLSEAGALSAEECARVRLLCDDCSAEAQETPREILSASHLLLTMKRSMKSAKRMLGALKASGPLPDGRPRVIWSVGHHIPMRSGMNLTRRLKLDGFELPAKPERGVDEVPGADGRLWLGMRASTGQAVAFRTDPVDVYEYTLTV
ncbi:unnamed protein product [Polarella glacialis]|uniref:Histone-lysine N-methyltransferase, H3 lysine-79 specific n=1 Tax=Polarella glacialis TaxID=89957 RepID=A0A813GFA7_POLGL|nr:unnamed protein product [Polarella glacialis]